MTTASNNVLHVHMGMSVLLKDRRVKAGTYSLMTTVGDFFLFSTVESIFVHCYIHYTAPHSGHFLLSFSRTFSI